MGLSTSTFTRQELEEYSELTYFSEGEIIDLFKKFSALDSKLLQNREIRVSKDKVLEMQEIKFNPFGDRLCELFSTSTTQDGSMSFDDFLDMMNMLSEHAVFKLKAFYAFKIFDFNNNGFVDSDDIEETIQRLTVNEGLHDPGLMECLIESIMKEADLDKDNQLSLAEFEHVLSKSPDFMTSFKIRI